MFYENSCASGESFSGSIFTTNKTWEFTFNLSQLGYERKQIYGSKAEVDKILKDRLNTLTEKGLELFGKLLLNE